MIVEAPLARGPAQMKELGRFARIAAMGHHAVEGSEPIEDLPPGAALIADAYERPVALRERARARKRLAGPLRLGLDFRIAPKQRARSRRQAKIDGVAVIIAGKAELEADRVLADRALDRQPVRRQRRIDTITVSCVLGETFPALSSRAL
jgi:hypothetical protein